MYKNYLIKTFSLFSCLIVCSQLSALGQGPLTPAAAPAPTMKTLDQVEPRMPITNLPFNVTQSGSYYLTGNLTGVAGQHGINISANQVTIDLMGFSLIGVPGSLNGIHSASIQRNITVRNGNIRNWSGTGVSGFSFFESRLEGLNVRQNNSDGTSTTPGGISAGRNTVVQDCKAHLNTGHGFLIDNNGTAIRCEAVFNSGMGIAGVEFVTIRGLFCSGE